MVSDGLFGVPRNGQWDGITADLVSGAAHMAFTAFSVTSSRIEVSRRECVLKGIFHSDCLSLVCPGD